MFIFGQSFMGTTLLTSSQPNLCGLSNFNPAITISCVHDVTTWNYSFDILIIFLITNSVADVTHTSFDVDDVTNGTGRWHLFCANTNFDAAVRRAVRVGASHLRGALVSTTSLQVAVEVTRHSILRTHLPLWRHVKRKQFYSKPMTSAIGSWNEALRILPYWYEFYFFEI